MYDKYIKSNKYMTNIYFYLLKQQNYEQKDLINIFSYYKSFFGIKAFQEPE